jgi:RNA-directed DNA polymerase
VLKSGNADGAKALWSMFVFAKTRKENRLKEFSATENEGISPETQRYEREQGKPIPLKVSVLRRKLAEKAKHEPRFRFYSLYDRIYRFDVLRTAWELVRRNRGSSGVDNQTITDVERYGIEKLLQELQEELKTKHYYPLPVRRVHIPKGEGQTRPLGIPTVRDRIVQQAIVLILEPIFDTDFLDCSYGYRPGHTSHQAMDVIRQNLNEGRTEVYDADLKGYFDSIPHDQLMKAVTYRISDRSVLNLIRKILEAAIVEKDSRGQTTTTKPQSGTPQGGVISPLLANLYLHWFDKVFHGKDNPFHFANARLVRYADDFVIMARYMGKRITQWTEQKMEGWLKLQINREKTKVLRVTDSKEGLRFLGFQIRYVKDLYGRNKKYFCQEPSDKKMQVMRNKIHGLTSSRKAYEPISRVVYRLNQSLRGWAAYYRQAYPQRSFRKMDKYILDRMIQFLKRRSQRPFKPPAGMSWYEMMYKKLGVIQLQTLYKKVIPKKRE